MDSFTTLTPTRNEFIVSTPIQSEFPSTSTVESSENSCAAIPTTPKSTTSFGFDSDFEPISDSLFNNMPVDEEKASNSGSWVYCVIA
ncbi:hypothetical protein VKT23_010785 [Stygiomarasmius scandens]|uniref:Uncharacterized protein n=1 Tax=Marasmiellus scandens TaxID=2682957 RepID=A0ABR1JA49_9AGAR